MRSIWAMHKFFCFLLFLSVTAAAAAAAACGSGGEFLQRHLNLPGNASRNEVSTALDLLLATHAFRALLRPRTGTIYDVPLPMWIQGAATVQAARLKTASLIHRGFFFNEFIIPPRVAVSPSPSRASPPEYVVLVYRFFATRLLGLQPYCSEGFDVVGPVVGIKVYDGTRVGAAASAAEVDEVRMVAEEDPITVRIPILPMVGNAASTMCAFFDGNGSLLTADMTYVNLCSLVELGDTTLVVPASSSVALLPPSPSPSPSPSLAWPPHGSPSVLPKVSTKYDLKNSSLRIAILCIVAAAAAAAAGALAIAIAVRIAHRSRLRSMEKSSGRLEALEKAAVGTFRSPAAASSRTRPLLERDYRFR